MAGTELVEPDLVWTPEWLPRPRRRDRNLPKRSLILAGVGHKP
jgi:hypothetical protein